MLGLMSTVALKTRSKMGSFSSSYFAVIVVLALVLSSVISCHGGKTSIYVRKVEKTVDMPLDSDVFRVPSGYNAPQQVLPQLLRHFFFVLAISWFGLSLFTW